jgi:hypothetical protein
MVSAVANLRTRLRRIGASVLIAGLLAAACVYLLATDDSGDAVAYQIVDGQTFAIAHDDTKRYLRDVEMYGGKGAVMANDIGEWLAGLWHGRRLAYTLAWLSVGSALVCFWAAHALPDEAQD